MFAAEWSKISGISGHAGAMCRPDSGLDQGAIQALLGGS
jgi:hypothetical protein